MDTGGAEAEVAEGAAAGIWPFSGAKEKAELGGGARGRRFELGEELEAAQVGQSLLGQPGSPVPALPQVDSRAPDMFMQRRTRHVSGVDARHEIETLKFCGMFCQVPCCVVIETTRSLKR